MLRKTLRALLALPLLILVACCQQSGPADNTLNRSLGVEPESLDVHTNDSTQAATVLRDLGEGLVSYSATGELVPAAAERWELSDDGLVYRFWLRSEARWSNGDRVLAEHFAFAWRRLVDPATAARNMGFLADVKNAAVITEGRQASSTLGVEAAGELEFVVTLERPTPYFLSLLTHNSTYPIYPPSIEEHGANYARPGRLVSNGAYQLDDWQIGSVIELSRNESYWNNAATSIDRVRHFIVPDIGAEANRFRAGEIDISNTVPPEPVAVLREEFGDTLRIAPYVSVYYYGLNLTKPPFKDNPKLRQALSMAIDREALTEHVTGRGQTPAYSWVPMGINNYESIVFSYAEDSQDERNATARRLYEEAGYGPANPLQVELRYNTSEAHQRIALSVQAMWREALGFEATLINEEFQVLLAKMRAGEETEVFRSSWSADYNDANAHLSILRSGNPSNLVGYRNTEYDSLLDRAANALDPQQRRFYLEEAERVLLADHPLIPIYFYVSSHLVSDRVDGWQDNVLDYHYSQHLSLNDTE